MRESAVKEVAIEFNFVSDWLTGWREHSIPIKESSKETVGLNKVCRECLRFGAYKGISVAPLKDRFKRNYSKRK